MTVGTGVGIGLIINGKCVHGLMHPEGGHARVPISKKEESDYGNFKGVCSFHGNCIEGLVSNVAIKQRLGLADVSELEGLSDGDPVWRLVGEYLGAFLANIYLTISVERFVIGGGICSRPKLMELIRAEFLKSLSGYAIVP